MQGRKRIPQFSLLAMAPESPLPPPSLTQVHGLFCPLLHLSRGQHHGIRWSLGSTEVNASEVTYPTLHLKDEKCDLFVASAAVTWGKARPQLAGPLDWPASPRPAEVGRGRSFSRSERSCPTALFPNSK